MRAYPKAFVRRCTLTSDACSPLQCMPLSPDHTETDWDMVSSGNIAVPCIVFLPPGPYFLRAELIRYLIRYRALAPQFQGNEGLL